jgi:hypothetical protein
MIDVPVDEWAKVVLAMSAARDAQKREALEWLGAWPKAAFVALIILSGFRPIRIDPIHP